MIEIDVEYEALYSKLVQKRDEAPNRLANVVNNSALDGQGIVMSNAPIKKGNLRAATRVENRGLLERVIFPDQGVAPYALWVITGSDPHVIKGNPWLSWPGAKHPVKKVNHPGNKPNDYMKRSIPAIKSKIESNLEEFKQWLAE